MEVIKEGQKISVSFEAKLETGETVLKTEEGKPLEVTIGEGVIPASLEKVLLEMKVGETKTITLKPEEAFGPRIDDLLIDLPKKGFSQCEELEVGSKVSMNSPDGRTFVGFVKEIKDETINVDFNHPLAGQSLIFTVTIVTTS